LERALAAKHQRRSSQLLQELGASVPEAADVMDMDMSWDLYDGNTWELHFW